MYMYTYSLCTLCMFKIKCYPVPTVPISILLFYYGCSNNNSKTMKIRKKR